MLLTDDIPMMRRMQRNRDIRRRRRQEVTVVRPNRAKTYSSEELKKQKKENYVREAEMQNAAKAGSVP